MSDSLGPHELQHARPPCSSPTPRVSKVGSLERGPRIAFLINSQVVQIRDRTLRTAVLMVKMNKEILLVLGLGVGHLLKYHNGIILS